MSRIWLAVLLAGLGGCYGPAAVSSQHRRFTGNAEALAGARATLVLEARFGGAVRNLGAELRMERVARPLIEGIPELGGPCRFRLLDSDHVNAFSLPGGYIYITRGLYIRLTSEGLLAAALAHEMAHIAARDHFKPRPTGLEAALAKELSADAKTSSYAPRVRGSLLGPRRSCASHK